jgi:hypothetical protein
MAVRFLIDEDFDNDILRGVLRRLPVADMVRVQEVGLSGATDPVVLEWAAKEGRILLTHDVSTMRKHATDRVQQGLPMPGVFAVPQSLAVGKAIEDVVMLAECSQESEWEGQVRFLKF